MRSYQNPDNLWFNIRNMNDVSLFYFNATADAKDYLQNFNLLEANENLARYSHRVHNHAAHKQAYNLT